MPGAEANDGHRVAHFVFGLRPQEEPFHLVHYLAIASCRAVLEPDEIIVHCDELPYGIYWDLIRPSVTLHRVDPNETVSAFAYDDPFVAQSAYAHQADIVRLDALLEHGGVYADIDTLFVAPPPAECWSAPAALGREADMLDERIGTSRSSISNAVIFAHAGAHYLRAWRAQIEAAIDGSWSAHSCFLADDLAQQMPGSVHVEPQRTFHHFVPTADGLRRLLVDDVGDDVGDDDLRGVSAVHLCAHLWWAEGRRDFLADVNRHTIDEAWVRAGTSTYARLARPFLPDHGLF